MVIVMVSHCALPELLGQFVLLFGVQVVFRMREIAERFKMTKYPQKSKDCSNLNVE
jgi:hypothetical protein